MTLSADTKVLPKNLISAIRCLLALPCLPDSVLSAGRSRQSWKIVVTHPNPLHRPARSTLNFQTLEDGRYCPVRMDLLLQHIGNCWLSWAAYLAVQDS